MIANLTQTVTGDLKLIYNFGYGLGTGKKSIRNIDEKVVRAALRLFATCAMATAAISGIGAAAGFVLTPIGSTITLAKSIVLYVLAHDSFIVLRNQERSFASALGNTLLGHAKDVYVGKKKIGEMPCDHSYDGTFLRLMWDALSRQLTLMVAKEVANQL